MNDQKCQELYEAFVRLLNDHGFQWVIAEVDEQIRFGKTAPEQIQPVNGPQLDLLEADNEPVVAEDGNEPAEIRSSKESITRRANDYS